MFRFLAEAQQIMANNRARKRMTEEGGRDLMRREVEALEAIASAASRAPQDTEHD
jgi:hypothetical protein